MGVNVLLFLVFQFGFEPWRRRGLVHGFEEKVREALEKEKFAAQERSHELTKVADVPLDSVIAAGIQELAESGSTSSEPAVDAVVACMKGEQEPEEKAPINPENVHVPTELMKLRERSSSWAYKAQATFQDLFSNRLVEMRKQDITLIALESAATGAAIVTIS